MNKDFIIKLKELLEEYENTKCNYCSSCPLNKTVIEIDDYYRKYDICDLLEIIKEKI